MAQSHLIHEGNKHHLLRWITSLSFSITKCLFFQVEQIDNGTINVIFHHEQSYPDKRSSPLP